MNLISVVSIVIFVLGTSEINDVTEASFRKKVEAVKVEVLEKGEAQNKKAELWQKVQQYWALYTKKDFEPLYSLYADQYQKEVELAEFLKKNRFAVNDFEIVSLTLWGDACAQIRFKVDVSGESMMFNQLSIKQQWVFQNNEWRIYENPFRGNHMVSPRKDVNAPCVFPAAKANKKK